ncbi:uncharacterized protein N0V89_000112 [Didymosphaeria variabile]|uniref:Uncharacterized protein n=1 Tax=Didymosphaeria variabile TaxID=1932322 RepID=A0A9W8XTM5_9PLEO|nr:uncharacterized protein N0V89_000112 [Didymosphaeria variabile]KAJ4359557.1 hypothetical protein N0V89_000112 [Didymosphaeria variabile]
MLGTLLMLWLAIFAHEADLFYTKSIVALRDQLRHLEVALELVKKHAAAQKTEILQLRLNNTQLRIAHEVMKKDVVAQQAQLVQLQLDNEQLKVLISTMTLTEKDQEDYVRYTEQRIVNLRSQNVGLANKLMASRRQIFRSEQERRVPKGLSQRIADVKTLVNKNINAIDGSTRA